MIDPELQPYLAMWTQAWSRLPPNASVQDRRDLLEKLSDVQRQPLPAGVESETRWTHHGGRKVRICIFRRTGRGAAPCLIYMHGGAFMQGSPETHDAITAGIAAQAGYTVISVDYALAPEQPFPAAMRDCEAVVRWAFASAAELAVDPARISVGGDSAGANLAAVMTLIFRGTPLRLRGQLLFYPPVDTELSRPSFTENAQGPIIRTADMARNWALYCPNPADLHAPFVAPLRARDHAGLPPAFIAIAEHDPLRDDGKAYAERLAASGVSVELHPGTALIHGYLRAMNYSAAVRAAFAAACVWLQRSSVAAIAATHE
jgi:acetyl esterase